MPLAIEIEGLERVLGKLDRGLIAGPVRDMFTRAAVVVQGRARTAAPTDTGHLRNLITTQVDTAEVPLWAKIGFMGAGEGSPLWHKGRAMEYGTGSQGDPEVGHTGRHWPPGDVLDVWARRHGFENGWQVAAIIGRRGGLRPRRFLRGALEQSLADIRGLVERLGREIGQRWGR